MSEAPLRELAAPLQERCCYVFFSHQGHFLDPLVPRDWARLRGAELVGDPAVLSVVRDWVPQHVPPRGGCIFFPVPISRGLETGTPEEELAERFRYDMIRVDAEQRWSWRGQPVSERNRRFFLEALYWEPAVARYAFEYKVHSGWWDKSYFEAVVTPWLASAVELEGERPRFVLQDARRAALGRGFRIDRRERLFVELATGGEALLTGALRFQLLREISVDLQRIRLGGIDYPVMYEVRSPLGDEHRSSL